MKIRLDKKLHFLAGMLLVSVTFPFVNYWSMALCLGFAFGKELLDKYTNRVSEFKDAAYTICGGLLVMVGFILGGI